MFIISADIIEKTVDKVRTTGLLEINKIRSPETMVWLGKKKNQLNSQNNFMLNQYLVLKEKIYF